MSDILPSPKWDGRPRSDAPAHLLRTPDGKDVVGQWFMGFWMTPGDLNLPTPEELVEGGWSYVAPLEPNMVKQVEAGRSLMLSYRETVAALSDGETEVVRLRAALRRLVDAADAVAWGMNTSMLDEAMGEARRALGDE